MNGTLLNDFSYRPGDIAKCYAKPKKAEKDLFWEATKFLVEGMCRRIAKIQR
ncbi:hypothetical protein [Peribacillus frigoritolerans]|uniref:hypothetical protein n=1 Tax=Peribacillus frigoritolerans TaxID=450367 RepID=UPI0024C19946|nr:hypothetical protein [Peribacillus frigoritolerans]WHX60506.1 hypothetical protein QNH33_18030 [Peribacillus frigoritolerans]